MTGGILKFPKGIKPFIDSYKQAYVGLISWQCQDFVEAAKVDSALTQYERMGKGNAGIALSESIEGLPDGPGPNISHPIRSALMPLIRGHDHHRLITSLTQFLVGHCYAIMEDEKRLDAHRLNVVVQFLKHVRNGCFHGNRFYINAQAAKGKAWREAKWRGKEITPGMSGRPVFRASFEEAEFFLNWGDATLLLADVCAIVY